MTTKQPKGLRLNVDECGFGVIELDGMSIGDNLSGVDIKVRAGQPLQVTLRLGPVAISGDLLARLESIGVEVPQEAESAT